MKTLNIALILLSGACLLSSCFTHKKVAEDGTVTTTRTTITTLKPNTPNPSQSVINASGDGLTIGIPNGNDLRAGSSENATVIANNAIAKVNGPTGVNQQRLDSLTSVDFMNKIAVHQMTMIKMSTLILSKSPDKKIADFAKVMLASQEAEQKDLKRLSSYKNVILPGTVNVSQQANNLTSDNYMQMVIEDQQNAIRFFEVGNKSKDAEIKAFATKYLPISRRHLQEAQSLTK
jgi:putative membrane protein